MSNEITFGFIDYFIAGAVRRLPVQFFSVAQRQMARLDCVGGTPLIVPVEGSMRAESIGAVASVAATYSEQVAACLQHGSLWDLRPGASTTLMLFRTVHAMRTHQFDVRSGVRSVLELDNELRLSESGAAERMSTLLAASVRSASLLDATRD